MWLPKSSSISRRNGRSEPELISKAAVAAWVVMFTISYRSEVSIDSEVLRRKQQMAKKHAASHDAERFTLYLIMIISQQ
ncbi:unnamed protein product, partial [Orchesella dallaii]